MSTETSQPDISRRRAWVIAARPQTMPAALAPVLVGTGLAVRDGVFAPLPALVALVGAALIQIGTNFANDYYDAERGADTADREGFTRVTAGGLIDPAEVKRAMWLAFLAAILVGAYLVAVAGVPIMIVGLVSVAMGVAYTGGPYPLAYHGLGDVFVFVFFGLVAVTGTYYVQAAAALGVEFLTLVPRAELVPVAALVASLPIAAISTDILVVNNLRDREEDAEADKNTLTVRFGYGFSRAQFVLLLAMAYAIPPVFAASTGDLTVLLPLATFPLAVPLTWTVLTETAGDALNPALERTGKLLAAFAALFALGLAL
ncbi:1,4-dihydroxy-2-naphthoate polyprenyltransferase [Halobaculum gomorrense]|uniref:1,4-dihydroxy-2-naphthoate octaprenyltransferase n=1 Tax=Halobaculum gomorrense TaxID=43928 RepID=A0A1M5RDB2_9EURY|nr:1,4-dihydroxy-2-naphthoate polyprenyltransferase [Halobaculum gomorrense]SHH24315.1 1,4-dihydroxy-2-naphthoate prenyltransferase [Halobaculum gomorrense]